MFYLGKESIGTFFTSTFASCAANSLKQIVSVVAVRASVAAREMLEKAVFLADAQELGGVIVVLMLRKCSHDKNSDNADGAKHWCLLRRKVGR